MSAATAHKPIVHFVGSIPLRDAETGTTCRDSEAASPEARPRGCVLGRGVNRHHDCAGLPNAEQIAPSCRPLRRRMLLRRRCSR